MAEAKEEVLKSNPGRFPSAEILYLGWVKEFKDKACKKSSSSLVIAFENPRHANQAILEGIFLRGALIRTELYDPGCRVVQCSKCYQFGHVAAMCPSTAACPFCTLAHGKKQCPIRKNPTRYKCTNGNINQPVAAMPTRILQWNVRHSVDLAMAPMLRDPKITNYTIIAIQSTTQTCASAGKPHKRS
jgi:hypothetical protein